MLRKLAVLLVLLVPYSIASANRRFEAPVAKVFSAAEEAIRSRGLVLSTDRQAGRITFLSAWFEGTIVLTEVGQLTDVVIETKTARVKGFNDGAIDFLHGSHDLTAKKFLGEIGKVLEGKPLKPNQRLLRQSRKVADMMAPPNPATALIHGTKEEVQSALVAECATRGLAIISETEHQITVSKEAANLNIVSELLIGSYSIRAYRVTVQFMFVSEADGIRVTPLAEALARNGYGATFTSTVTAEPDAIRALQAMLDAVKKRVESKKAF